MEIRFTRRARRHKVGILHALSVILNVEPVFYEATEVGDPRLEWVGEDDRGLMLHIVAVLLAEDQQLLVIHVMPDYRGRF